MSRKKPAAVPLQASGADGHPETALVPFDEDDRERFLLARNPRFHDLLARSAKSGQPSSADAEAELSKPRDSAASGAKRSKSRKPGKKRRSV